MFFLKYTPDGVRVAEGQWGTTDLDLGGGICVAGDTVYMSGGGSSLADQSDLPNVLISFDAETGDQNWVKQFPSTSSGRGGIDCDAGPYVSLAGHLVKVSSDGATIWDVASVGSRAADSLAVDPVNGVVYSVYEELISLFDAATGAKLN